MKKKSYYKTLYFLFILFCFGNMAVQTKVRAESQPIIDDIQPIIWFQFDEAVDSKTYSSIGDNISAVLQEAVLEQGYHGSAVSFDGKSSYVELPSNVLQGLDDYTISLYFYPRSNKRWQRVFDFGTGTNSYMFFSPFADDMRIPKVAVKLHKDVQENSLVGIEVVLIDEWHHFALTRKGSTLTLYLDGREIVQETDFLYNQEVVGSFPICYLGKSMWNNDPYFDGLIDDVKIYDIALSHSQVILDYGNALSIFEVSCEGERTKQIEYSDNDIILPVSSDTDISNLKVDILFNLKASEISPDPSTVFDYSQPVTYMIREKETQNQKSYTITVKPYGNPIVAGNYADPEIHEFNGTYYVYTTTDGYKGWGGYYFSCFSSVDLVHWKDEGIVFNLRENTTWSRENAWAPAIIEKDGKYYFYYSARYTSGDNLMSIGVAVADHPAGSFTDSLGKPLVTQNDAYDGQAIDPAVLFDPVSEKYYFYFGQGSITAYELNEDMISLKEETKTQIKLPNCREGIFVFYYEGGHQAGNYYFMWSENDTGNENYHVRYGVANHPLGLYPETKGSGVIGNTTVLQKDTTNGILATGHHSVVRDPDTDTWYICYHRFERFGGNGWNREVCLDLMTFNEKGLIKKITPSLEGILHGVENTASNFDENVDMDIGDILDDPIDDTEEQSRSILWLFIIVGILIGIISIVFVMRKRKK